jgi:hypothetical protein
MRDARDTRITYLAVVRHAHWSILIISKCERSHFFELFLAHIHIIECLYGRQLIDEYNTYTDFYLPICS